MKLQKAVHHAVCNCLLVITVSLFAHKSSRQISAPSLEESEEQLDFSLREKSLLTGTSKTSVLLILGFSYACWLLV